MRPKDFPIEYREEIDGDVRIIPFHTDFSQWLRFEELITDSRVPEDMLTVTALRLIFYKELPLDLSRAALFMLWFYRCGAAPGNTCEGGENILKESRRTYSFEADFEYIAAAFMEKYRIDLWEEKLHWWKFHALFMGLHDCRFTDICGYRNADIDDDMSDSRRDFLLNMQKIYALPVHANELIRIERQMKFLEG